MVVLALSTSSLILMNLFGRADAQTGPADPQCPAGTSILINNTAPTTSMVIPPGVQSVSLAVPATMVPNIKAVIFTIDNDTTVLGRGVQVNSNPYYDMKWLSQMTPGGQHNIGASLTFTTGGCRVPQVPVTVNNPTGTQSQLAVGAAPLSFEGQTNEPRNFVLNAGASGTSGAFEVTPWTYFKISPVSLGVVTPADGSSTFRFSAGPSAGTSTITVLAQYAGITRQLDIPVKILAQTTSATTTSGSGTGTSGGAASTAPSSAPTALESDAPVKQCVVSKIGDARYNLITSGKERPNSADFEAFALCFAIRNYVIPSSWAPVEAKKETIQNKPASSDIKVAAVANTTDTKGGTKKQALKFNGKAKPDTKVLLYIFSEPLVVATSADKNGDWSYSLEDPLAPGKHEAYALVNKGDGSYERSSVFSFAVAKAEAASSNPNGLSLKLERNQPTAQKASSSTKLYIAGVAILVVIVAGLAANLMRIRSKKGSTNSPPAPLAAAAPAAPALGPVAAPAPPPPPSPIEQAVHEPGIAPDKPGETIQPKGTDINQ
jgi:hypothetical protein